MGKGIFRAALALFILTTQAVSAASASTIAEVKATANGTPVTVSGKIVTSPYGARPSLIYIEEPDRSAGIGAFIGSASVPTAIEGAVATVSGKISTQPNGERIITNAVITVTSSGNPLKPLGIRDRMIGGVSLGWQSGVEGGLGPNNVGALVRTWGIVKSVDLSDHYFVVDDGSKAPVQVDASLLVNKPSVGDYVWVTGLVSTKWSGSSLVPIILPRGPHDVTPSNPWFEKQIQIPVASGQVAIHWLGQAGWLLRDSEGRKIAVDPYLDEYKRYSDSSADYERLIAVPIAPEKLKPGLTLVTHRHGDHCDPWTLKAISSNSQSVFWGPTTVTDRLKSSAIGVPANRVTTITRGQTLTWNDIPITAVYANHPYDTTPDAVGYFIVMGGKKIYISGDTLYDQTLVTAVEQLRPDIICICINGQGGNMSASEAASLVKTCNPTTVIPMHYGMFACNTVDPQTFVDACAAQDVTSNVIVLGTCGWILF